MMLELERFTIDKAECWREAVERTIPSPGPTAGPELVATSNHAVKNMYFFAAGDLWLPLERRKARHLEVVRSTMFRGVRYNSLLGVDGGQDDVIKSLGKLPSGCDISLQIPQESFVRLEQSLASLHYLPAETVPYYFLSLPDTYQEWFEKPRVCRKAIRKAEKSGVVVKFGGRELLDEYYRLQSLSFERWQQRGEAQVSSGMARFERLFGIPGGCVTIALAHLEKEVIAGTIFCHYNKTAALLYSGANFEYQDMRPNNLVHAEIVRFLIEHGVRECNMGSDLGHELLARFKKSFAPEIRNSVVVYRNRFHRISNILRKLRVLNTGR